MNKTTKQWLESIEDPVVREKALKNMEPGKADVGHGSFYWALSDAFIWMNSPEDWKYWLAIARGRIPTPDKTTEQKLQELSIADLIEVRKMVIIKGCPTPEGRGGYTSSELDMVDNELDRRYDEMFDKTFKG